MKDGEDRFHVEPRFLIIHANLRKPFLLRKHAKKYGKSEM